MYYDSSLTDVVEVSIKSYQQLRDADWLRHHHHELGLNQVQIARLVGCSTGGVRAALVRTGLYRPRRRPRENRILGHVSAEQLLQDAKSATSWNALGIRYAVARVVIQDHALFLGIQESVAATFAPRGAPLSPNHYLASRDWIAETWAQTYRMQDLARAAGTSIPVARRWMRHHGMDVPQLRRARDGAIVIDYLAGAMLSHLAVTYRLDPAAVYRVLRAAGVDTSSRRVHHGRWTRTA